MQATFDHFESVKLKTWVALLLLPVLCLDKMCQFLSTDYPVYFSHSYSSKHVKVSKPGTLLLPVRFVSFTYFLWTFETGAWQVQSENSFNALMNHLSVCGVHQMEGLKGFNSQVFPLEKLWFLWRDWDGGLEIGVWTHKGGPALSKEPC